MLLWLHFRIVFLKSRFGNVELLKFQGNSKQYFKSHAFSCKIILLLLSKLIFTVFSVFAFVYFLNISFKISISVV